jgi:hypothetical protein
MMRSLLGPSVCEDWGNRTLSGPKTFERGGQWREKGAPEQGSLILPSGQLGMRKLPLEGWFGREERGRRLGVDEGLRINR